MNICRIMCDLKKRSPARPEKKGGESESCCLDIFLHPLRDDSGFVLIVALVILVLITLLGIAALNTTTTEIQIAAGDRAYKQAFYNAETGISYAVEASVKMFPLAAPTVLTNLPQPAGLPTDIHLQYIDNGASGANLRSIEVHSTGTSAGGGTATLVAGFVGIMPGGGGGYIDP